MATIFAGLSGLAVAQGPAVVDLVVDKTDAPDPATVGGKLVYTINVTNEGGAQATGVTVVDELPATVDFVSASDQCTYAEATRTVTCQLGNLAAGASKSAQITVRPREAGQVKNEASATATEADAKPGDNRDLEQTKVNEAPSTAPTCGGEVATVVGTDGDDNLVGTPKRDVIVGLGGSDVVQGFGGNDTICGNGGEDELKGQGGRDLVRGGGGNDLVRGGGGDDRVRGGSDDDVVRGGTDDDDLRGGGGKDVLVGHGGDDVLRGGGGRDRLSGGGGDDLLRGGGANDKCRGGTGSDERRSC